MIYLDTFLHYSRFGVVLDLLESVDVMKRLFYNLLKHMFVMCFLLLRRLFGHFKETRIEL